MLSQISVNLRLTLARLSPFVQLQRHTLQSKRQSTMKRLYQEKVYILDLEIHKTIEEMKKINTQWTLVEKRIQNTKTRLEAQVHENTNTRKTLENFQHFLKELSKTKNLEVRVSAVEQLVQKVQEFEKSAPPQSYSKGQNSILKFKLILSNLLEKLKLEIDYWKKQDYLESLKEEHAEIEKKLSLV